jgi:hypothetical protein
MEALKEMIAAKVGYAADPAIEILLPKDKLAIIKVRKIDMQINELQSNIDSLVMVRDMLKKEFQLEERQSM